ncbi:MAG TPA: helix-turn-helix domain-containing protein [Solirubrobacteraceae bacterium]|nr:helix-turn-helix domain-containing protein [Solirubrobacteraceae bacterium]
MTRSRAQGLAPLPPALADLLEPELAAVGDEILTAIGSEIDEYTRPLEGAFGRAVRSGVDEALGRFVRMIRAPGADAGVGERTYFVLGREEHNAGRTLDSLQAAYRIGARVAWRRLALACRAARVDEETLALLAESIFAYIDELSAESVDGYAQAQVAQADERQRARSKLVMTLVGAVPSTEPIASLASAAQWAPPRRAAALVTSEDDLGPVARRLGPDAICAFSGAVGCIVLPDPDGPGRAAAVRSAAAKRRAALGPPGSLEQLPRSWHLAVAALERLSAPGLTEVDAHLGELVLSESAAVAERIAEVRLGGLVALSSRTRERMEATALAFVQHGGNAAAMARALDVHPQTVRYRVVKLRELLGDQLGDPTARFELETALRHRVRLAAQTAPSGG